MQFYRSRHGAMKYLLNMEDKWNECAYDKHIQRKMTWM